MPMEENGKQKKCIFACDSGWSLAVFGFTKYIYDLYLPKCNTFVEQWGFGDGM